VEGWRLCNFSPVGISIQLKKNFDYFVMYFILPFNIVLHFCSGDKIENEMGGACNAYGGEERLIQDFGGETRRKESTWETQA
jgi:hypothetical protein